MIAISIDKKLSLNKTHNGDNINISRDNTHFIPHIIEKLKWISLYNCIEKEVNGIEYYKAGPKSSLKAPNMSNQYKKFNEYHLKFTEDQYELVKNIEGSWKTPNEDQKIINLKVDLSYDVSITLNIVQNFIDFDQDQVDDTTPSKSYEGDDKSTPIIGRTKFLDVIESCTMRDNTFNMISLDIMSVLWQEYLSHLLHKLASPKISLGFDFHYSEASYFKYYINQLSFNKNSENTLQKKNTIIIIEVENFKMIMSVKTKSNSDSEYVGTFSTKEVKMFTIDLAEALMSGLA